MENVRPFKGTVPYNEKAENLISPSTDHLSEKESLDIFKNNYWNYLKILNPVGKTKEEDVLKVAKNHFVAMKKNKIIKKETKPCYYIYQIKTKSHVQVGFLAILNINMFINNKVKGHEKTYTERTKERADQILNLEAQIGPIYVTYEDDKKLNDLLFKFTLSTPQYDFFSFDNSRHTLWCIKDSIDIKQLTSFLLNIKNYYIADGHHRISAMKKIYESKISINDKYTRKEDYSYFMIAAFPKSQSKIYDYNRVIKDLNGLSVDKFITCIKNNFECEFSKQPVRPTKQGQFGMYHEGKWYLLKFKKNNLIKNDILSKLDINIIDNFCLKNILNIKDANTDDRIRFIPGCFGLEALEKKVNDNPDSIAFSLFPTQIDDVIEIANNNLTMPPKSTWFDPKPLDGLIVYEFRQ